MIDEPARDPPRARAALPTPARPSFQELLTGDWDSQLIELDGIVRGIHPVNDSKDITSCSTSAVGTWRVMAQLPGTWPGPLPEHLVDAEVRIRGVAGTLFNQQRQLVGLQLFIPSLDMVTTLAPSSPIRLRRPCTPSPRSTGGCRGMAWAVASACAAR